MDGCNPTQRNTWGDNSMIIQMEIPDYLPDEVITVPFNVNSIIEGYIDDGLDAIGLRANSSGLLSLAIHLIELAQLQVPVGSHIHYDNLTMKELSSKSVEIIIEKIE